MICSVGAVPVGAGVETVEFAVVAFATIDIPAELFYSGSIRAGEFSLASSSY